MQLPEEIGKSGFTLRACAVAALLAVVLAASSVYICLSLGAMPWPVLISVIASGALLKLLGAFKPTNIHEMNVAQAGASIGGVLASAAAFTIPGMWFLSMHGKDVEPLSTITIAIVCITAGILGILLSVPVRRVFIDEEQLPYASGKAGAEVMIAGDSGGKKALLVLVAGSIAGLFMVATYFFGVPVITVPEIGIPEITIPLVSIGVVLAVALYIAPLAAGIGYILGPRISVWSWFGGSLVGWGVLVPFLFSQGMKIEDAVPVVQNLGMGVLLGSGVGFLILYMIPNAKKIFLPMFSDGPWYVRATPIFSLAAMAVLFLLGVPPLASFLAVLGVWVVVSVAARMTGETDIDPYEQFGIIIVIAIALIFALLNMNLGYGPSFIIVTFVTVAAAVVGDIGFDYKSAKIIGTKTVDMVKVDLIAVLFAGIATPFVLDLIRKSYASQLFTPMMPATQAQLVAGSIAGFAHPDVFIVGFTLALLWEIIWVALLKKKSPISSMAFGIGMFIGFVLSVPFAVGGVARYAVEKKRPNWVEAGMLAAAGVMGGVGVGGFARGAMVISGGWSQQAVASWNVFGGKWTLIYADLVLVLFFTVLLLIGAFAFLKKRR